MYFLVNAVVLPASLPGIKFKNFIYKGSELAISISPSTVLIETVEFSKNLSNFLRYFLDTILLEIIP